MDHIIENHSKQDVTAVVAVHEAILMRLKTILPHVKTAYLQSDNAGCYQNTLMVFILPYFVHIHTFVGCVQGASYTRKHRIVATLRAIVANSI